jgi:hypothetical protein
MERLAEGENAFSPTNKEKNENENPTNGDENKNVEFEDAPIIETKKNTENIECYICLDTIKEDKIFQWPECSHKTHIACAEEWLESSRSKLCPICDPHNSNKSKEKPNHNQFQELSLFDLEMLTLLEENPEIRQHILDDLRLHLPNQFESQPKRDEYRSQQFIYNEPKTDRCSLCSSLIPFQTEMCQNCAQILEDSFRSQQRNHNVLNHPNKLPSRNQIVHDVNNCASCSKKLPFNEKTFGWEEVCDECQQKNDNAKTIKNQVANEKKDSLHLNPNKPHDDNIESNTNRCQNFCSIL